MHKKISTLMLVALLLSPVSAALTVITVGTQEYTEQTYIAPLSETYSFSLAATIYDLPVYRYNVAFNYDMGTVDANEVKHVQTEYTLRGDGAYYVNASYRSFGEKHWSGFSQSATTVYVNGTAAWAPGLSNTGLFGSHFDYEETHMVSYSENTTAVVPADANGAPVWDWAMAPALNGAGFATYGRQWTTVDDVDGWFYVRNFDAGIAFRSENNSNDVPRLWLGNVTHGDEITASTFYQDTIPEDILIAWEAHEEISFFGDAAASETCDGIARMFLRLVGVCPTLASVVAWAIGLVPNILAFFLDFVSPQAASFLRLVGEVVGEFTALIVFTSTLVLLSPGKLFLIIAGTVSGAINLAVGLRGDMGDWFQWHVTAFRILFFAIFWYFYLYFLLAKLAVETIISVVDTIGNYIPFT